MSPKGCTDRDELLFRASRWAGAVQQAGNTLRKGLEGGEKGFPEGSPLLLQLSDPQSFGVAASKKILINNNNLKHLLFPPDFKHRSR